jgi:hypothetical protein
MAARMISRLGSSGKASLTLSKNGALRTVEKPSNHEFESMTGSSGSSCM